jgi:hypothetical protein
VAAAHFANGTGTIAGTAALLATNTRDLQSIRHLSPDVEHRTMGAKGSNANAIASKPRLPGYPLGWPLSGNLRRLSAGFCFPVANGRKQSLSQRSSYGRDKCPYHPAVLRVRYAQKVTCNRRDYSIEKDHFEKIGQRLLQLGRASKHDCDACEGKPASKVRTSIALPKTIQSRRQLLTMSWQSRTTCTRTAMTATQTF